MKKILLILFLLSIGIGFGWWLNDMNQFAKGVIADANNKLQPIDSIFNVTKNQNSFSFELNGKDIICNDIDRYTRIDSVEHQKLKKDFPNLKISPNYNKWDVNVYYDEVILRKGFKSKLLLSCFDNWGGVLHILNYNDSYTPISSYQLIKCGGDGGFSECSSIEMLDDSVMINSEILELSEDMEESYETKLKSSYILDDSLRLVLKQLDTISHVVQTQNQ